MKVLFGLVEQTPDFKFDFLILWQFNGLEFAIDARHVIGPTGPLRINCIAWIACQFWLKGYDVYIN